MGRPGIAASAAVVAGLTAVSAVLGFARDATVAAVFGIGRDVDAYLVAQGLMNLVLALLAGAVARAVVPTVTRAVERGKVAQGHRSVSVALTVLVLVLAAGSAVLAVFAEPVVRLLAPGFDDAAVTQAAGLTRVVLLATVLIGATNVLAGAVQAHGRFGWSATQGIAFNVIMVAAALTLGQRYGVVVLAVAFVVGSAARLLVQLPAVRAAGIRLRPSLDWRDPGLREMAVLVPPLLVGSALTNVNALVDRAVGSSVGEGAISALNYGFRLVNLADTLFVAALATSLYPAFAAAALPGREAGLQDLVRRGTGILLVLLAPVAVVLAVSAEPLVGLLLGRGEFDAAAVSLTAQAVAFYAAGLVGLALREPATRAFYAVGDTRTPTVLVAVGVLVNVVGDLTLGLRYGVPGLAASTSASLLVVGVLSVRQLGRRVDVTGTWRCGARVAAAVAVAAPLTASAQYAVGGLPGLVAGGALCVTAYVLVLRALGTPELSELLTTSVALARRRR